MAMALTRFCLALGLCTLSVLGTEFVDDECSGNDGSCSLELHQLRAQKEVLETVEAVEKVNKTAKTTGACTAADAAIMAKFGGGNADGTFPKILSVCGKGAYSFWSGFKEGSMSSCIMSQTKLSSSCASCYAASGKYSYDNCKLPCLFGSWCSGGCLSCSQRNKAAVDQCAGVESPKVDQC
ncbi:unnamed protein product [Symbiodinium pilosum]|uniref:Uncharacterized protein n=1 Tax=Symbiodinium pilosum TaxID=2952 RepID=A0A812KKX6_SYMPI|nr:unnamed protein product [Symbiodinium pilosum]